MSQVIKKFIGNNQVDGAKIHLDNNQAIRARNAANSADIDLIKLDASNIAQVTGALNASGAVTGSNLSGTNTGNVTLTAVGASPSANAASLSGQALTLQPADGSNPGVVTAGTQTFGGAKTFSLAPASSVDAVSANELVRFSQLAALTDGLKPKAAVRVASTANGTLSTAFANGQVVDGVTLATGDRILIWQQTTDSQNGIYTVNASGAPTRASDFDAPSEIPGSYTVAEFGTLYQASLFVCLSSPGTIGTDPINFAQRAFSAGANTALSNLTTTSINQSLIPASNVGAQVLGSAANFWGSGFISALFDASSVQSVDLFGRKLLANDGSTSLDFSDPADLVAKNDLTFDTGALATIQTKDDNTVDTWGLSVLTGDSVGFGSGAIVVASGTSDAGSGSVAMESGAASASAPSGAINMGSGSVVDAASGDIGIISGSASGNGTTGTTTIATGDATGTGVTGAISIRTGSPLGGGDPGEINITTGNPYGPNGGNISILTASAQGSATNTGNLLVKTGGPIDGQGGSLTLGSYNTQGGNGSSGEVVVTTGNADNIGNTGAISLLIGTPSGSGTRGKIKFVDGSEGTAGNIWTSTDTLGNGAWASAPASATNNKELFVLSGTDITNQYVDLAHVAKTNSIHFVVKGGGTQIEGASYDYSVSYTGGAGGNTRITFLNDLATGGPSALVAADVVVAQYQY